MPNAIRERLAESKFEVFKLTFVLSLMEFDLENPLKYFHDLQSDSLASLFPVESDHMPSESYVQSLQSTDADLSIRQETISFISQSCCNFDPILAYLAITYLDRFLSNQGLLEPKPWILRLLAVSCVSLAAKMKKYEFSLTDFQGYGGLMFDKQTIKRMEILILGALKWRMRSITPFSFIPFFISFFEHKHPPLTQALKARATEIIFKAQTEINLLEFKPSAIAASALLSASHELFPGQYLSFRKSISHCSYVNKDDLFRCFNAMQVVVIDGYESVSETGRSSDTSANVLDIHYTSSESESMSDTGTVKVNSRAERDA